MEVRNCSGVSLYSTLPLTASVVFKSVWIIIEQMLTIDNANDNNNKYCFSRIHDLLLQIKTTHQQLTLHYSSKRPLPVGALSFEVSSFFFLQSI